MKHHQNHHYEKLNTDDDTTAKYGSKNPKKRSFSKRARICAAFFILIAFFFGKQIAEVTWIFYKEFIRDTVTPEKLQDAVVLVQSAQELRREFTYSPSDELPRLIVFDELWSKNSSLPKTWDSAMYDSSVSMGQVDSNTCFKGRLGGVNCLPSLIVVGFEKCSSTTLQSWLSRHPNLVSSYFIEPRFFNSIESESELESKWHDYLKKLPKIPGGNNGLGTYWTFEKSPSYVTHPTAAQYASTLLPSARILVVTRNPTPRAYSLFLMFTNLRLVSRVHKICFFAKNMATGDVEFINGGGVPGKKVPTEKLPTKDEWRFLSFPPDPKDFDTWIRKKTSDKSLTPLNNHRETRVLGGGLYSEHLKKWARNFPPEQIVVIPRELFFTDNIYESMNDLQRLLGLPVFDYSKITKKNEKSGQYEIQSLHEYFNRVFNTFSARSSPMLDSTKKILDEYYCEYNMELSRMLGGRALPGYSCAENGVPLD